MTLRKQSAVRSRLPLTGIRVLVGRARHQASALSAQLCALGATVLEIPFIEIRKPRSFEPLDSALMNLSTYDWLILTSVNGVAAMGDRMAKLNLDRVDLPRADAFTRAVRGNRSRTSAADGKKLKRLRIAAIGPATKKAIEKNGVKVDVVPKEYVAESVVRSLRARVNGKRVLLVRAKVARDVIPRELRQAGARVDIVEAYETVIPHSSRKQLRDALRNPQRRPHVVTFTSSSTVRNFVALLSERDPLEGIRLASIGPVTSSTLRELGLRVDVQAKEFTIPSLVEAVLNMAAPKT